MSPTKVLILTAPIGSGHVAAAHALRAELEQYGHEATVIDGLQEMSPVPVGALNWIYISQLRHLPQPLAALLAITALRPVSDIVRFLVGVLFAGRLLRVIEEGRPDVIVSTYPLVTAALGYLRGRGKITVPVVALVTDYGVHPLWTSPGVDMHLVASDFSADMVRRAGGRVSVARLPVAPGFADAPARASSRAALGVPGGAFVVLIVGGGWGLGDTEGATRRAINAGAYTVVVAGHNRDLELRLEKRYGTERNVRVIGWTDKMPDLMAASDCLIQNAGGVTCLEAIEMDLPIIIFDPIPGHGRLNARAMETSGVACWARTADDLERLLKSAAGGKALPQASQEFRNAPKVSTAIEPLLRQNLSDC